MKCPTDSATLVMSERNGIEIDYCPECRGVWLDRGELDKIIERAGSMGAAPAAPAAPAQPVQPVHPQTAMPPQAVGRPYYGSPDSAPYPPQYGQRGYGSGQQPYRKKKNWLGELFD
ncbi:TFIIB-type zinc ribbon-containing protein [Homoserinibacter sp. YIM 151385]|uniref:TFIIB-type zinc ribbon-containing protein n=1 Tax=Homoserinibacter sp. YIM 151385 TaxID=2985506 RepID=UPI0022EFE53A|nr:zf-TFIIB domain-containing protein [Homoserinibacter sp. YIM 151385]WBU38975.1 zf-TFIIB domain-containing protein [Homoserinibacter sp. YIM 151385]